MNYIRNPEIKKELILFCICDIIIVSAGFLCNLFSKPQYRWLPAVVCILFTLIHFVSSYKRYKNINRMCTDIDSIINGKYILEFSHYKEGELSVLRDEIYKVITRIAESEDMLKKDRKRLTESIADISHQLRTPLTSINLLVTMLSKPEIDYEHSRELRNQLKKQLSRIEWLVESLLKMSKLESGTAKFRQEPVVIEDLIKRAYEPFSVAMELKNQEFVVKCGKEMFNGDMVWSVEALGNIIKNCTEHTSEGGSIEIIVRETSVYIEIIIRDTGEGFCDEDIPRLFERFYKGTNASDNSFGIGLALSRMIITSQNGTIKAGNWCNGAQFTIRMYKGII